MGEVFFLTFPFIEQAIALVILPRSGNLCNGDIATVTPNRSVPRSSKC